MHDRRTILAGIGAFLSAGISYRAGWAHHGWIWTLDNLSELTGPIKSVALGNPHGMIEIVVDGEVWAIEVGYPAQNARAGLTGDMFTVGKQVTIIGQRAEDRALKWMKARRLSIDGQLYNLYPDPDAK